MHALSPGQLLQMESDTKMIKQETEEETEILQDTKQIKKEEVDPLSAHDDNTNYSFITNTEKVTYDLKNVKEEFSLSTDDCKPIVKELLRTFKVEDEEEEKCVIPLVPDGQQSLQPSEELILPDMLTDSSSSQNDSKMPKCKRLSPPSGSQSPSFIEVTNQESGTGTEPMAVMTRSRRSIVYSVGLMPDIPTPTVPCQVVDSDDNSSSTNLEINQSKCSVLHEPGLICFDSKKRDNSLQLQSASTGSFQETDELSNSIHNSNDKDNFGDTDKALKNDSINKKITYKNRFQTDDRKEVQAHFSVKADCKSITQIKKGEKINKIYSCGLCNRKFENKYRLRMHKDSKCESIKLFGCNICGKGFTKKITLMDHMRNIHISEETSTFKCDVCNKVYKFKSSLERHKRNHVITSIDTLPQTCKFCQKTFNQLHCHVSRVHSSKSFECADCSKVFRSRNSIIQHIQYNHTPGQWKCNSDHLKVTKCTRNKFICDHCGKAVRTKLMLINHLLTHTDEKQFKCQTCARCFMTESKLNQHMLNNHSNNVCDDTNKALKIDSTSKKIADENKFETDNRKKVQTPFSVKPECENFEKTKNRKKKNQVYFSCDLCNREFDKKYDLRIHNDSKCGSIKLFGCNTCGKGFTTKKVLMDHTKYSHRSEETPTFKCDMCFKVFRSKKVFACHKRTHVIESIGTLPQTCKFCPKTFNTKQRLRCHVARVHGSKLFECAHCSKVFKSRDSIIQHMQYNHIPGRWKCNSCRHIFSSKDELQDHLKVTKCTMERFICDHCGKAYKTKLSLTNHLESLSVNLTVETNTKKHSDQPGLVRFDSKESFENVQLQKDNTDSFKRTDEMSVLNNNSNYVCDDSNKALKSDSISKKITDENTFETGNKGKEVQIPFSVKPEECKNFRKTENPKKKNQLYLSCDLCNRKFDRRGKLKLHKDSKCGSIKLFGCNVCYKGFTTKKILMDHIGYSHRSGETSTVKCDVCSKVYRSKKVFGRHKCTHVFKDNGITPMTCEYCQKSYFSKERLKGHVSRIHVKPMQFECAHCSRVFKSKIAIALHMKCYHLPDQWKCTSCKKFFCSEDDLHNHLKAKHCAKKKLICDQCGTALKNKSSLANHLLTHSDEKKYICQTCGKCFRTESNLNQHSVTHSDIRPFSCDICSKSFRIRNHLRQHMSVHGLVNTTTKQRQRRNKKIMAL